MKRPKPLKPDAGRSDVYYIEVIMLHDLSHRPNSKHDYIFNHVTVFCIFVRSAGLLQGTDMLYAPIRSGVPPLLALLSRQPLD